MKLNAVGKQINNTHTLQFIAHMCYVLIMLCFERQVFVHI